jgi:hypothetical protein
MAMIWWGLQINCQATGLLLCSGRGVSRESEKGFYRGRELAVHPTYPAHLPQQERKSLPNLKVYSHPPLPPSLCVYLFATVPGKEERMK